VAYFTTLYEGPVADRTLDGFRLIGPRGEVSEVITPATAAARYGAAIPAGGLGGLGALPLALHYAVTSVDRCAAYLRGAGVAFETSGGALIVPAAAACGVTTVFDHT
jgi:hypothetical protein